jgi:EmrB/QacA subfamily drug resistance transporter
MSNATGQITGAAPTAALTTQNGPQAADPKRWLILAVVALAQLMVVLDATIVNIALPSAQRVLGFSNVDRQWVVTAYALAFGSLLLLGGRLSDLLGRKTTFLVGLAGFAAASAAGGAATSFGMLVAARACQGAFGALLAPSALALLTVTFSGSKDRGKAFGVFGAIAGAGGAVGLLLGGLLTEYLSWRWCLYVNLIFAAVAAVGAALLLRQERTQRRASLDLPGLVAEAGGMFCIVYGFSNAASDGWHSPATWGFLAVGGAALAVFAWWEKRASQPLLPLRVVLDRNRAAAYLSVLIAGAGMFGIFLFLTYYLQETLGYSPVATGVAFLPMVACVMVAANLSNIVLLPRIGPKFLVAAGMLAAAAGLVWLTRIGLHSSYLADVLPPLLVAAAGIGMIMSPSMNTGTSGVRASDAGVASALVNTGQQVGGSIGTSLLNTLAASATAAYVTAHLTAGAQAPGRQAAALAGLAQVHGYVTAFWWAAAIFACGAIVAGLLFRRGVPAPSTTDPSTTDPSTTNPSTTNPSTTNPSTTNPSTPSGALTPSIPSAPSDAPTT